MCLRLENHVPDLGTKTLKRHQKKHAIPRIELSCDMGVSEVRGTLLGSLIIRGSI